MQNIKKKRKKIENEQVALSKEFAVIIDSLNDIILIDKAKLIQQKEIEKAEYFNQLQDLLKQNADKALSEADKKKVYNLTFAFDRADEELSLLMGDLVSS